MNIEAFILIGGRSSRFDTDKAFVKFNGDMLAERAARIAETALAPAHTTFIAAKEEQFDAGLLSELERPVIYDLKSGFGAWSALYTALFYAKTEWIFFSACDLPLMSPELVKLLAADIADNYDAVVPRQPDGRLQPLCAFYRVTPAIVVAEGIIAVSGRMPPLTSIVDSLKSRVVEQDEYYDLENADNFFVNINTAADLASITGELAADKRR